MLIILFHLTFTSIESSYLMYILGAKSLSRLLLLLFAHILQISTTKLLSTVNNSFSKDLIATSKS